MIERDDRVRARRQRNVRRSIEVVVLCCAELGFGFFCFCFCGRKSFYASKNPR
jgi:hypothetical protein